MTIQRSTDAARIKALAAHPAIFPWVADDYFPDPEKWEPTVTSNVVNLLAIDELGDFGFGIFHPKNYACFEGHLGFLPRSYGPPAIEAFTRMLAWMWENTTAARIVGEICQDNSRALQFAVSAGFESYGVNQKSILRGGRLRDQICLGISRP